ncbi:phage integrase [Yersinia enterocolitica]
MSVRKLTTGKWLCECYPSGRDKRRIRKSFPTKGEAVAYEQFIMNESVNKPWMGDKPDTRCLKELTDLWFALHGRSLSSGDKIHSKLRLVAEALGDPIAANFTAKDFAHYRNKRLTGEIKLDERFVKGSSPVTINLDHSYLSAMFEELIRLEEWKLPNPLEKLRKFTISEREMAWLDIEQINELLGATSHHIDLNRVIRVCLCTGARWSESQFLTKNQLSPNKITFTKTKGKKNRTVPISADFYEELKEIKSERLFSDCYYPFLTILNNSSIVLPKGQLTHVLRHSFAAHFMMNGGNILVLQKILGHHDINMTMRYAHFAPEHLDTAVTFNPLAMVNNGGKVAAKDSTH